MTRLNIEFPGILLGYVTNQGYTLSPEECNELTKLFANLEYKLYEQEISISDLSWQARGYDKPPKAVK